MDHGAALCFDSNPGRAASFAAWLVRSDEHNLLEISSPDSPGERLVACRNTELARMGAHTRDDLLAATQRSLEKVKARVDASKLMGKDKIRLITELEARAAPK